MANSGLHHHTTTPSISPGLGKYPGDHFISRSYPASVAGLSEMLLRAHQESPCDARALFKKSHTCGSLFAKCGCDYAPVKRSSNPIAPSNHPQRLEAKRLSSPEIHDALNTRCSSERSKNWSKRTNLVLNHPEIPFPVTADSNDEQDFAQKKANLDYHRLNALAYEQQLCETEEAQKFLKEFGIFGPMGNGVAVRRSSRSSPEEALQQRKNSRSLDGRRSTGAHEDYEYLRSVVTRLKKELSELEVKYGSLQTELLQTQKNLEYKESEVLRLQREVHKLKVRFSISLSCITYFIYGDTSSLPSSVE